MALDEKRRKVFDLLMNHTQVPRSQALQILDPQGLRVGDRVIATINDEQIEALLAAAKLTPRGPHFETAWSEVVSSFPGPAKPASEPPADPPAE
jgi:hypothetical protein